MSPALYIIYNTYAYARRTFLTAKVSYLYGTTKTKGHEKWQNTENLAEQQARERLYLETR